MKLVYARLHYPNNPDKYEDISLPDELSFRTLALTEKKQGKKIRKGEIYLEISKTENYIKDFFGGNLNITAIAGKNGAGKSLLLEALLSMSMTKEYPYSTFGNILIFKVDNSYYMTSNNLKFDRVDVDFAYQVISMEEGLQHLEEYYKIYYTPQFTMRFNRKSHRNFVNRSLAHRMDEAISPINLNPNNRNIVTYGQNHLHGAYDNFDTTIHHKVYILDMNNQVRCLLGMNPEQIEYYFDDLKLDFEITTDLHVYLESDTKIDMYNNSDHIEPQLKN